MKPPRTPDNEAERLAAVRALGLLDSERDEAFDALIRVASSICEVPIAAITLVDDRRQWFLASVGFEGTREIALDVSFCGHTILEREMMVVEDALADERFVDNPMVVGAPKVRFYAGCQLIDKTGYALGTLCVADQTPRRLAPFQVQVLGELATAMARLLEARKVDDALFAAERAEKRALADLALVLDAVPATVSYWDQHHLNRFANGVFSKWFGRSSAEVRGRPLREVIGDGLYTLNRPHLERAFRGEPQHFEREVVDAAGTRRHASVTYVPDVRDGTVHGIVSTMTDVSDLKEALLTSQRRTELLQLSEELAAVGHWRVERGKDLLYWSPQVFRVHGRDPATFIPTLTTSLETYHPSDREKVRRLLDRAFECQEDFAFDLRIVRADGVVRRVHSKARCEVDPTSGRTRAVVGVLQDITEREALRDTIVRQERLVTTGTLAAGVGHEINNPLTYISSNIEFAIEELGAIAGPAADGRLLELLDVLDEARDGAERIGKIVRGLRSFARESAAVGPVDVHAALETALDMAAHELRTRATVRKDLADIPLVLGEELRLSQVFVNLLVNAAQAFTTDDVIRNRIVVRTKLRDDGQVAIEFVDNGPGIAPDVLPRIFDPFFTTKRVGQGTGLGLSICHSIMTSLGGEITCTSELGVGTTFRVVVPIAGEQRASRAPALAPPGGGAGARVMVVDDDEAVLRAIARLLGPEHRVTPIADPREALRAIQSDEPFDVVFCDLMMPYLSGMELFRRAQECRPALAERFVFITGGTIHEDVRAFLAQVPNECLEKPFNRGELRSMARRFAESAPPPR